MRGRRDVCFYAMNYLNCIPQGNLVCESQGVIELGFSSNSNNNTMHYSILHITRGFQRDFVHVLSDTEASVVQDA